MRPTICSLFARHHKQNLYTNPKRTAKSSTRYTYIDVSSAASVQNTFLFQKTFSTCPRNFPPGKFPVVSCPTFSRSNIAPVHGGVKVGGFVFENKSSEIF